MLNINAHDVQKKSILRLVRGCYHFAFVYLSNWSVQNYVHLPVNIIETTSFRLQALEILTRLKLFHISLQYPYIVLCVTEVNREKCSALWSFIAWSTLRNSVTIVFWKFTHWTKLYKFWHKLTIYGFGLMELYRFSERTQFPYFPRFSLISYLVCVCGICIHMIAITGAC